MAREPENVVFVVVDALRADRVGALGCDRGLTPAIDDLADDSAVFENAFSCINTTDPSVTSIHTGRFPRTTVYHHGRFVSRAEKRRVEAVESLPQLLRRSGRDTIATGRGIGRWHVRGFDSYPGTDIRSNETLHSISDALERVSPRLQSLAIDAFMRTWTALRNSAEEYDPEMSYREFHRAFASEERPVEEFLAEIGPDPFYGFVHLMDTHTPYTPAPETVEDLLDDGDYSRADIDVTDGEARRAKVTRDDAEYGVGHMIARYDAAVREADRKIARLVEGLQANDRWDDTALFVLADHGELLDEHGVFCDHHTLYDESIRVPLIGSVPGAPSQRVDEFVQLPDLFPTVLDLVGIDHDPGGSITGRSLRPLLFDEDEWESRDAVFAEEAHTQRRVAVRTADWKYVEHREDDRLAEMGVDSFECRYCHAVHGGERELYDLAADPAEETNLADDRPETVADMRQRLDAFYDGLSYPGEADVDVEYDDEEAVLERLKDLGYR